MKICSIILLAGDSLRFKYLTPKQYFKHNNEILVNYSIKKFNQNKLISNVILVVNPQKFKVFKKHVIKSNKILVVKGGKTRQESTFNALRHLQKIKKYTHVIIHDAARPYFSYQLLKKIIFNLKKNNCVIPAVSSTDTVIFKKKIQNRDKTLLIQTPQGFNYNLLYNLFKKNKEKITDESSLFYKNKKNVKIIKGEHTNIKINTPIDLFQNISYGIGFDVHKLKKKRKLIIGGITIPFDFGPLGHSDGDSVIHALIDSLLGATGNGDIGMLFPNTPKYKDIKSSILLEKIIKLLKAKNIFIHNIDINIIIQKPNLTKYKNKIKINLARMCKIKPSQINVKAKTTDKLGLIGKNKALACEVIATVKYAKT